MSESVPLPNDSATGQGPAICNVVALALAAIATGGSLYLSLGLGLKACPLCFYQRSLAIAAVLVLVMLIWLDGIRSPPARVW